MRAFTLWLFAASLSWGTGFTTVRSGNWSDTSSSTGPWCSSAASCATVLVGAGPGGTPGLGDTITLAPGHVLSCPAGSTCVAGTDTAGQTAILRKGTATACGALIISDGAVLEIRGHYASDCWTTTTGLAPLLRFDGAAIFRFAGSNSYLVAPVNNGGNRPNDQFVFTNQTSTKRAQIISSTQVPSRIAATGLGVSCLGCMGFSNGSGGSARYVDVKGLGDAASAAIYFHGNSASFLFDLADYSFTDCGGLVADVTLNTAAQVRLRRGVHLFGKANIDVDLAFPTSNTGSGEFLFEDVWIGRYLRMNGQYVTMNRVFLGGLITNGNIGKWKAWTNSILRKTYSEDQNIHGPVSNLLVVLDNAGENQHIAAAHPTGYGVSQMIDGLFIDSATKRSNGGPGSDIGDGWLSTTPSTVQTYYVSRLITGLTPERDKAATNAFTLFSSSANFRLYTRNNTAIGPAPTVMSVQENGSAPGMVAGQVTAFLNTIVDRGGFPLVSPAAKARITSPRGGEPNDIFVLRGTDYNAGYNLEDVEATSSWTNRGKGYALPWSVTPGRAGAAATHDIDVVYPSWRGPRFVDRTRSTPLFDTQFLGNRATPWTEGTSYPRATTVTNAVPGWYGGEPVNYVCISSSGCPGGDATTEPGRGPNWRAYWMYASFWRIATAIQTGSNSITSRFGQKLTYVETMSRWFQEGFLPQNPLLWQSGCLDANFDGLCEASSYVGAVDPAPLVRAAGAAAMLP